MDYRKYRCWQCSGSDTWRTENHQYIFDSRTRRNQVGGAAAESSFENMVSHFRNCGLSLFTFFWFLGPDWHFSEATVLLFFKKFFESNLLRRRRLLPPRALRPLQSHPLAEAGASATQPIVSQKFINTYFAIQFFYLTNTITCTLLSSASRTRISITRTTLFREKVAGGWEFREEDRFFVTVTILIKIK